MKKKLILALALVLALSMVLAFASCGKKNKGEETTTRTPEVTTEETRDSTEAQGGSDKTETATEAVTTEKVTHETYSDETYESAFEVTDGTIILPSIPGDDDNG